MKPSKALRIARNKIKSGEQSAICFALPFNEAGNKVRKYISVALFPHGFYNSWIRDNYPKIFNGKNLAWKKEGRLQWIDWMIKEYERIGQ